MSLSNAEDSSEQVKNTSTEELETSDKGDEQAEGQTLEVTMETTSVELADPAILEVRGMEKHYRYTRDELLKLRNVPLSLQKPVLLNYDIQAISINKRSETPAENGPRTLDSSKQKRNGDPRDRLRKDLMKIVLSPQRESFNHGCCVPGREATRENRSHSPIGKTETPHIGGHSNPTRRIGSGRIMREPWDYPDKGEVDFSFRRERRDTDERYERRSFGRDFDMNRDKDKERERHIGRGNSRYNDRRRISNENREEEPEWFSGGPVSQTDTIELRGFEESDKIGKKKPSPAQKKRTIRERAITKIADSEENAVPKDTAKKSPTTQAAGGDTNVSRSPVLDSGAAGDATNKSTTEEKGGIEQTSDNLDYFLSGSIPKLLANGVDGEGEAATASESRFTQFFKRESPHKQRSDSPTLSDDHIIKNLLKDIAEPSVYIPGDSNQYFAPISPAANTGTSHGEPKQFSELMEMIQRGKQQQMHGDTAIKPIDIPGKVLRVEEVEGLIRQGGGDASNATHKMPAQQKSDEDMAAFRKLIAQISPNNGTAVPQKRTPMTIMEMLIHSQQVDEVRNMASASHLLNSPSPNVMQQQHEVQFKLQQMQNQSHQLNNIGGSNVLLQQPLQHDMGIAQARELLSRPEAQAILQGLQRGDITPQHLHQQLAANTAMQARHRELLFTILKMQGGGGAGPNSRVSPVPPSAHPMFHQQQQQLRVSPLPPNAMHQRIPSPRELQVHTQNILQRALIKKKLEEQQENFRKKQEMQQRGQSPNNATKSVASPTPLAFTPTSVLRKMTAEKEEVCKEGNKTADVHGKVAQGRPLTGIRPQVQQNQMQQQWHTNQYPAKQPGRPILKSNPNFQQAQPQMPNLAEQHFYQQQQQRMYGQQQRKTLPQQFPANNASNSNQYPSHSQYNPSNQFPQLTQQQLRAQHQQHVRAAQQGPYGQQQPSWQQLFQTQQHNYEERGSRGGLGNDGGDLSPTSNQLARWFSPNLLKKAKAGELPNMPTTGLSQHALSLEELERQTAAPVHN